MEKILTRDNFREGVFERDKGKCVFCDSAAKDAHHILERRLWPDGGYYLSNGASVCEEHHIKCETTEISVEEVRLAAGITKKMIPPHMYDDVEYDKWGNVLLADGRRLKGELFFDESVQKILEKGGMLSLFLPYVKYPRSYHLPWSQGVTDDDRIMPNIKNLVGKRVIATIKMDGENCSMYTDYIHARSLDSNHHYSRNWVKNFWSTISYNIPPYWRLCGENLFAKHSIKYEELESFFLAFSIWNEKNRCLSWDDSLEWFELIGVKPVEKIYDGIYDEKALIRLADDLPWDSCEGYVLRTADEFDFIDFKNSVGKYVRKGHVMTAQHWMYHGQIEENKVKTDEGIR